MLYKLKKGKLKMETLLKFDRVVLTKELNDKIKNIGEVFEIANIMEGSFLLREEKSKVAVGVVSFEDFDHHFVKEEDFKGWTNWAPFIGFDGQNDILYRTNRRKIQVKSIKDGIKSESCCHRKDNFNLYFGIRIAYLRCVNKALGKKADEYAAKLSKINSEVEDNENIIRSMINSL